MQTRSITIILKKLILYLIVESILHPCYNPPMSISIKERPCWFKSEKLISSSFGPGQQIRNVYGFRTRSTNPHKTDDSPDLMVYGKCNEMYSGLAINRHTKEISRAAVNLPERIIGRKITFIYQYDKPANP